VTRVKVFFSKKDVKEECPKKSLFTAINLSSVKKVADRQHSLTTSFLGVLTSMTLNDLKPQNRGF